MAEGHSVIIGNPEETTSGVYTATAVATASGPGGGGADRQLRDNQAAANASVEVDTDATDQEIMVIGQRIKANNQNILNQLSAPKSFNLPCIGTKSSTDVRKIALGLKFRVRTKDYGEGRAGENLAKSGTNVRVDINKDALKVYDSLPGGLTYLSLHEIAHSFKEMRDFNKQQFENYSKGAGAGLSLDDRKAQFPNSAEFIENEARANSIAKALSDGLNGLPIGFEPRNGYSKSC